MTAEDCGCETSQHWEVWCRRHIEEKIAGILAAHPKLAGFGKSATVDDVAYELGWGDDTVAWLELDALRWMNEAV